MKWFHDLKIGTKLQLGFLLVASITVAIGIIGIACVNGVNGRDAFLYENTTRPLAQLARISTAFEKIRNDASLMISASGRGDVENLMNDVKTQDSVVQSELAKYRRTFINKQDKLNFENLRTDYRNYCSDLNNYARLVLSGDKTGAAKYRSGKMKSSESAGVSGIDMMIQSNQSAAEQATDSNAAATVGAQSLMLALLIAGGLISVLIGVWLTRLIMDPLKKTTAIHLCFRVSEHFISHRHIPRIIPIIASDFST